MVSRVTRLRRVEDAEWWDAACAQARAAMMACERRSAAFRAARRVYHRAKCDAIKAFRLHHLWQLWRSAEGTRARYGRGCRTSHASAQLRMWLLGAHALTACSTAARMRLIRLWLTRCCASSAVVRGGTLICGVCAWRRLLPPLHQLYRSNVTDCLRRGLLLATSHPDVNHDVRLLQHRRLLPSTREPYATREIRAIRETAATST